MTKEEHQEIVKQIMGNLSDQGKVSELLTNLSEDYGVVITESETNKTLAEQTQKDMDNLREYNMKLFLKLGEQNSGIKENEQQEPQQKELTFDSLFDESGNLK